MSGPRRDDHEIDPLLMGGRLVAPDAPRSSRSRSRPMRLVRGSVPSAPLRKELRDRQTPSTGDYLLNPRSGRSSRRDSTLLEVQFSSEGRALLEAQEDGRTPMRRPATRYQDRSLNTRI